VIFPDALRRGEVGELPKQNDTEKRLEDLLERLFVQSSGDVVVLKKPKLMYPDGNCCTESYGSFSYTS